MSLEAVPVVFSDAPLKSRVRRDERKGWILRREIDEAWLGSRNVWGLLEREIEAGSRIPLKHERLVGSIAASESPAPWVERSFFPMGTVGDRLRRGPPLSAGELATVAGALASALSDLHALQIAHGDPSPGNLLLAENGSVRLADPASARRAFAGELALPFPEAVELDCERACRWLARAVRGLPARTPEWEETLAALASPGVASKRLRSLQKFLERGSMPAAPVAPPAQPAEPKAGPVDSVAVVLRVGPIGDGRTRYRLSRNLAERLRAASAPSLNLQLASQSVELPSVFPEPARTVAAELVREGCPVEIAAAVRGDREDADRPTTGRPAGSAAAAAQGLREALERLFTGSVVFDSVAVRELASLSLPLWLKLVGAHALLLLLLFLFGLVGGKAVTG